MCFASKCSRYYSIFNGRAVKCITFVRSACALVSTGMTQIAYYMS